MRLNDATLNAYAEKVFDFGVNGPMITGVINLANQNSSEEGHLQTRHDSADQDELRNQQHV